MERSADKIDLRERIVMEATHMFQAQGVKQVRMDDIARGLSISKKTLYELFSDKEELLLEANKWELAHGGLSGRTAVQYIDYLMGVKK